MWPTCAGGDTAPSAGHWGPAPQQAWQGKAPSLGPPAPSRASWEGASSSGTGFKPWHHVAQHARAAQVAPTALKLLGLNPAELQGVQAEGTQPLPGLSFGKCHHLLPALGSLPAALPFAAQAPMSAQAPRAALAPRGGM